MLGSNNGMLIYVHVTSCYAILCHVHDITHDGEPPWQALAQWLVISLLGQERRWLECAMSRTRALFTASIKTAVCLGCCRGSVSFVCRAVAICSAEHNPMIQYDCIHLWSVHWEHYCLQTTH